MNIHSASSLQPLIQNSIQQMTFGEHPHNLYEPIRYIMSLGGKRLRPVLALLSYQLGQDNLEEIVRPALAVEVFHNFTLMHDDIMDKAPLRRGQMTVHEKWDETVAILSGDTMLVKAYDLLLELDPTVLPLVLKRFNQTAVEVCEGQQIDMNFETMDQVREADYLEMIRLKTAVLLGFSLEYGAMMAGINEETCHQLYQIGEQMGLGFQLMDDYLDVYADKAKFGKQVGGDIIANKKTYLLIEALEKANDTQLVQLDQWIEKSEFDPVEKVAAVTKLYDEIGIPDLTKSKMNGYFDRAMDLLEKVDASDAAKDAIRSFSQQLMKREK